ncbi:MAG TPA: 3'-5' exonuclease, partial [Aggregatilineaceae bacterium]|nr:3'-5' exonuclease [Aggregatilineaceae bacterium]
MRDVIVALDLETTGLNPEFDDIIEVGAARFENGELRDTFGMLINPDRSVPEKITAITGIRTEDLIGAPSIHQVLPDLRRFIGRSPVIGHRIDFDLAFLNRQGLDAGNLSVDTYDLASVMLPTAPRYNLNSLTGQLSLELEHAHRALDDAIGAGRLYWVLWQRILDLPLDTLREIVEAARDLDWSAKPVFVAALQERSRTALTGEPEQRTSGTLFEPDPKPWKPLRPN